MSIVFDTFIMESLNATTSRFPVDLLCHVEH